MSEFEKVKPEEFPADHRGNRPTALSAALGEGDMVFVPGWEHKDAAGLRGRSSYLSRRGLRLEAFAGERNGVAGLYLRAVPR